MPRILKPRTSVCQICNFVVSRSSLRPKISLDTNCSRVFTTTKKAFALKRQTPLKSGSGISRLDETLPGHHNGIKLSAIASARGQKNIEEDIREATYIRDKIVSSSSIPTEDEVKEVLAYCETVADTLVGPLDEEVSNKDRSAASALLSVDTPAVAKSIPKALKYPPPIQKYVDQLSIIAYSVLVHPSIFITPDLLRQYVGLQSRLRKPETFPFIFKLYASKPIPEKGSSPVKYRQQNPNKAANAIESDVADRALQSAIETKHLVAAMGIVESAYATKAFRRNKFVRKGLFPATGLATIPLAAYTVASQLSMYQSTVEPTVATKTAFGAVLAYMGFTAMIGVIAVTTANDHMDRVTWAPGMPLLQRWAREEERAAIDTIAGAWGFRESWRRGDEEGEEWDALREWTGRKGMLLDQTELMEGMQ